MDNEVRDLLQEYLEGTKTLEELRDWVALNIWASPSQIESAVDHLAIELSHLDDGTANEAYFRRQVNMLLGIYESALEWGPVKTSDPIGTTEGSTSQARSTNIVHIEFNAPFIYDEPIRAVHSFG